MSTPTVILTEAEVRDLSGGYVQPAAQLKALKAQGFWRARRSTVTGAVIVERAHYEAVAAGESAPATRGRADQPFRLKPA